MESLWKRRLLSLCLRVEVQSFRLFYADWFFNRLEKGYSAWTNLFNGVKSYVSYEQTRFIIFWSKNPRPLLPYLHILRERDIKCYIQYTLNDYEQEKLEKVPSLATRIETFKMLVEQLGKDAVIWRFDPMILTDDISVDAPFVSTQGKGLRLPLACCSNCGMHVSFA